METSWNDLLEFAGSEQYENVPIGSYLCEIVKAEATLTNNKKDMFKVRFKVMQGPHAGKIIFNNFVISPESEGAMKWFFGHMRALGLNADYFKAEPAPSQVAIDLVGRQAMVTVEQGKPYRGQPTIDVSKIEAVAGAPQPVAAAPIPSPTAAPQMQTPSTGTPPLPI